MTDGNTNNLITYQTILDNNQNNLINGLNVTDNMQQYNTIESPFAQDIF